MKLNNRRTILVGLAFMSICAFWQLYDFVVPLILRDTFLIGDGVSGVIMALDNVLALFMLPIFGRISDRTHTRIGRRMPFILAGTAVAVTAMLVVPSIVRAGSTVIEGIFTGEIGAEALESDHRRLMYAFIALLGVLLLAMGTYRSPAVALMPDVTPKALRSKGNAIINLMGAVGSVITLVMISTLTRSHHTAVIPKYSAYAVNGIATFNDYSLLFVLVAAVMALCVAILFFTINENKLRINDGAVDEAGNGGRLPPEMRRSLRLILLSVFFWFMGYNAVTTAYSKYFASVWGDVSGAASCLTIATVGAVVSYIPVGALSSCFGRKRMILVGVAILALCFGIASFIHAFNHTVYVLFVLIGFAWAAINVNSYPMVVEISHTGDVGKYTGYYYTFSMAGQIVTPILSGILLERVGYGTLFPYAALMVAVAFCTMLFVRHGDSKPAKAANLYDNFDTVD